MKDNLFHCPNCNKLTNANVISFDKLVWSTVCTHCDASFDIAIEEITTDQENVLIRMSHNQFVILVLAMDSSMVKGIDFYNSDYDGICYGVMYTNFLDSIILGIGGYSQNTKTFDSDGMWGKHLDESITQFVRKYLLKLRR